MTRRRSQIERKRRLTPELEHIKRYYEEKKSMEDKKFRRQGGRSKLVSFKNDDMLMSPVLISVHGDGIHPVASANLKFSQKVISSRHKTLFQ